MVWLLCVAMWISRKYQAKFYYSVSESVFMICVFILNTGDLDWLSYELWVGPRHRDLKEALDIGQSLPTIHR